MAGSFVTHKLYHFLEEVDASQCAAFQHVHLAGSVRIRSLSLDIRICLCSRNGLRIGSPFRAPISSIEFGIGLEHDRRSAGEYWEPLNSIALDFLLLTTSAYKQRQVKAGAMHTVRAIGSLSG